MFFLNITIKVKLNYQEYKKSEENEIRRNENVQPFRDGIYIYI